MNLLSISLSICMVFQVVFSIMAFLNVVFKSRSSKFLKFSVQTLKFSSEYYDNHLLRSRFEYLLFLKVGRAISREIASSSKRLVYVNQVEVLNGILVIKDAVFPFVPFGPSGFFCWSRLITSCMCRWSTAYRHVHNFSAQISDLYISKLAAIFDR